MATLKLESFKFVEVVVYSATRWDRPDLAARSLGLIRTRFRELFPTHSGSDRYVKLEGDPLEACLSRWLEAAGTGERWRSYALFVHHLDAASNAASILSLKSSVHYQDPAPLDDALLFNRLSWQISEGVLKDSGRLQDFIELGKDLFAELSGVCGFMDLQDVVSSANQAVQLISNGQATSQFRAVAPREGLTGPYWGNLWGAPYLDLIGRDKVLKAPGQVIAGPTSVLVLTGQRFDENALELKSRQKSLRSYIGDEYFRRLVPEAIGPEAMTAAVERVKSTHKGEILQEFVRAGRVPRFDGAGLRGDVPAKVSITPHELNADGATPAQVVVTDVRSPAGELLKDGKRIALRVSWTGKSMKQALPGFGTLEGGEEHPAPAKFVGSTLWKFFPLQGGRVQTRYIPPRIDEKKARVEMSLEIANVNDDGSIGSVVHSAGFKIRNG